MSDGGAKRKKDVDHPRITYTTDDRTFDRLFKEESLDEVKAIVRKKLGLSSAASVDLSQLREGKRVDLEDDDDFDAFYAFAHDKNAAEIHISFKDVAQSPADAATPQVEERPKKKRKKDRNLDVSDSQRSRSPSRSNPEPTTPKKKVSFAEAALKSAEKEKSAAHAVTSSGDERATPVDPPVERKKERKKKKDKKLATGASSTETPATLPPGPSQAPTTPSPQSMSTPLPSSEAIEPKKAKKKRKASALEAAAAAQPEPSTSVTTLDEPPPPAKKAKLKHATEAVPDSASHATVKQKKDKRAVDAGQTTTDKSAKAKGTPTSTSTSVPEPKKAVNGQKPATKSTVDAETSDSPSVLVKKKKSTVVPAPAQPAHSKPASSAGKTLEKQAPKSTSKRPATKNVVSTDVSDSSEQSEEDDSVLLNPELQALIKAEAAALIAGMIPSSKTTKPASSTPSATSKPSAPTSTSAQVPSQAAATPSPSITPPAHCIICGETPHHLRNRCPIVKGGIKSMRGRISELESMEPNDKQPAALITEAVSDLRALIQKKQDQNKKMNGKEKEVQPRTKSERKETSNKKQTEDPADGDRESDGEEVQTPRVSQVAGVDIVSVGAARAELSSETEEPEERLVSAKVASGLKKKPGKNETFAISITSTPKAKGASDAATTSTTTSKHQSRRSLQSPAAALTLATPASTSFSAFLDFGDLSQYNDKDLEALIRGPRLSAADVPSEDEDVDEEVPGQLLDDDDDDLRARKRNKLNYAGSSEEEDEEEDVEEPDRDKESDDEDARNLKAKDLAEGAHSSDSEKSDDDTGDASKEASKHRDGANQGNLSFGALGVLEGDLSIVSTVRARSSSSQPSSARLPPASQPAGDSDTLVGKNDKASSPEPASDDEPQDGSPEPTQTPSVHGTPTQRRLLEQEEASDHDPIEPVHEEVASPADPIHSDDDAAQAAVVAPRTRSQRNKSTTLSEKAAPAERSSQSPIDEKKTPRKQRSMSRLSELPVPPHPKSARKGKALSSVQPEPAEPQDEADEEQPLGTRKSARNKKPAPTKPASKVNGRKAAVPEDPSADRAKDAGPTVEDQEEDAGPVTRGKGGSKSAKAQTKVPPKTPTKLPTRATRSRKDANSSQPAETEPADQTLTTWVSLPEDGHMQEDADGGGMVDELASEPGYSESRDPLFMMSQTQEAFPYSQYPGIDPKRRAQSVNSDDSDDANEVLETVTRSQPNAPRPSYTFRGLSQIISDVTFGSYVRPRAVGEAEPEDLYGRPNDGESEESGSDSDSESEKKSHIPKERRAGLKA